MRRLFLIASLLLITGSVMWSFHTATATVSPLTEPNAAQVDPAVCQQIVREALQQVGRECAELGRNEACYGHAHVEAIPRPGVTLPTFSTSGDIVALTDLVGLFTRPYNPDSATWGVAMMSVQADLPESGSDTMRFVLFGDATVTEAAAEAAPVVTCSATNTSANTINVRSGPTTSAPILDLHEAGQTLTVTGQTLTVTGQTNDGWLRAQLDDGGVGWVSAQFYEVACTGDELPVVSATDAPAPSPMQVIQLSSGSPSVCGEAPNGLLIQAPEGQTANIVVNGVEMRFASSGFISVDGEGMTVTGLTGEILVNVPPDAAPNSAPSDTVDNEAGDDTEGPVVEAAIPPTDTTGSPPVVAVPYSDAVDVLPGLTTRIEYVPSEGRFYPSEPDVSADFSDEVETFAILRETVINNTDYDDARTVVTGDLTRIRDAVEDFECAVGDTLTVALPPTDTGTIVTRAITYLGGDKDIVEAEIDDDTMSVACLNPGYQGLAYSVAIANAPASVRGYTFTVVGEQLGRDTVPDADDLSIEDGATTTVLPTRYCVTGESVRIDAPVAPADTSFTFSVSNPSVTLTTINLFAVRAVCGVDDFSVVISADSPTRPTSYFIQPVVVQTIVPPNPDSGPSSPTATPDEDDDDEPEDEGNSGGTPSDTPAVT